MSINWSAILLEFNPLIVKLSYLDFNQLQVVSRYRDPQLQVGENYTHNHLTLTVRGSTLVVRTCSRQILTSKVDYRTVRVNMVIMAVDP